jgi:hypothetical protein
MTNRRAKNSKGEVYEIAKRKNRNKSRVRAKVEWPIRILKRVLHGLAGRPDGAEATNADLAVRVRCS